MLNPFKRKSAAGGAVNPIRAANLAKLKSLGFRVAPSLPQTRGEDETALRPRQEIVKRLAALEALCLYVSAPPDRYPDDAIRRMIDEHGLDAFTAEDEREILTLDRNGAHAKFSDNIGWKMENIVPLAWALGNPAEPRIDGEMVGGPELDHLLTQFAPKTSAELTSLLATTELRPVAEVDAMEDLFYCAHNAVRSAQFNDPKCVPRGFDPVINGGVIHERRHALTWMLSPGVSWDETDLST